MSEFLASDVSLARSEFLASGVISSDRIPCQCALMSEFVMSEFLASSVSLPTLAISEFLASSVISESEFLHYASHLLKNSLKFV